MRHRLITILTILILAALPAWAGNPSLEAELQKILETFLTQNPTAPGVSAAAICPELNLDWSGAAGAAAHGAPAPMTASHTFRIASNTKTYVAAAFLRLAEQDRISLEDPVSKYISAERKASLDGDGYDTAAMTLAQVLSHTAGLGDHTSGEEYEKRILSDPAYKWTRGEQLRLLVELADPVGKPGEKYQYSDSGYVLLGGILERITGKRLGPAVRELVDYESLGLQATFWEYMEETPEGAGPRAHQYLGERDVTDWYASYDLYGGGGIVTDSRDLALFMRKVLEGEVFENAATLEKMTMRGTLPYRLGLMVKECGGYLLYGHQGFLNTFAFHVPALDLTVGGGILNHDSANGFDLACRMVEAVAASRESSNGTAAKDSPKVPRPESRTGHPTNE